MPCFYAANPRAERSRACRRCAIVHPTRQHTIPLRPGRLTSLSLHCERGNLSSNTGQQGGGSPARESKLKKAVPCAMIERNRIFPGFSRQRTAP